jgi:hypothetical protein
MAMAYTPGLKRKEETFVTKVRKLPILGEVIVEKGAKVNYDTEVARTSLPGKVNVLNLARILELESTQVSLGDEGGSFAQKERSLNLSKYMLKEEGETCEAGEVIAQRKTFFGLFQRECRVPCDGTIEYVSDVTGQCLLREPSTPLTLEAYIPGTVKEVIPEEGVVIETPAAYMQGIFGIGGETHGELVIVSKSEDEELTEDKITAEHAGKIIVGGSIVEYPTIKKAVEIGVKGIIVGGIRDADLSSFLGYEIGVAITGEEKMGLTLILTEGFGKMAMAKKTLEFLKKFEGNLACINGATQIRAGVIRPEILIPLEEASGDRVEEEELHMEGLRPGLPVRVIGPPYFGAIGHIVDLPVELQTVETESKVRVLEAELEDGRKVVVPRANVEMIEE